MHINSIASIPRAVFGPARHEGVPACHGPCLSLIIDLLCQHGTARHDMSIVPKNLDPTRHEPREGRHKSQLYPRGRGSHLSSLCHAVATRRPCINRPAAATPARSSPLRTCFPNQKGHSPSACRGTVGLQFRSRFRETKETSSCSPRRRQTNQVKQVTR
jgi:hypothetical protein